VDAAGAGSYACMLSAQPMPGSDCGFVQTASSYVIVPPWPSQITPEEKKHYSAAFSMLGGGCGTSSLVVPLSILEKAMPTPSMTASRTAQPMAPLRADL